jgi:hypothetical protein
MWPFSLVRGRLSVAALTPDEAALSALHQNLADVTRGRRAELVGLTVAVPGDPEALRERLRARLEALGYPAQNLRLVHSAGGLVLVAAEFVRLSPNPTVATGQEVNLVQFSEQFLTYADVCRMLTFADVC